MKSKVLKIILFVFFISVLRYVGLYITIDCNNMQLLKLMAFYNPLINVRPVIIYIPPLAEMFPRYCQPILINAIDDDNVMATEILLDNGANPNIQASFSERIALANCLRTYKMRYRKNRYKIAKLLSDYGAVYKSKENDIDYDYLSAILSSWDREDTKSVKKDKYELFIEWAKNHNNEMSKRINIYTYYAVTGHCYNELQYMFDNFNVDTNYKYKNITLLEKSIEINDAEIFEMLIDKGAKIENRYCNGIELETLICEKVTDIDTRNKMIKKLQDIHKIDYGDKKYY